MSKKQDERVDMFARAGFNGGLDKAVEIYKRIFSKEWELARMIHPHLRDQNRECDCFVCSCEREKLET